MTENDTNEVRLKATRALGFPRLKSLTTAADVSSGTFSHICRGKRAITDEVADKLICAIQEQNGFSYLESAHRLAEALNYVQHHNAYYYKTPVKEITKTDLKRWHQHYFDKLRPAGPRKDSAKVSINHKDPTKVLLKQVYCFLQSWETKHDLNEFSKVKQNFEENYSHFIEFSLNKAMREGGRHYDALKKIYPEIRYIAHLCHKFDFVVRMSTWLINQAEAAEDIPTKVSAIATYAWELTSDNTPSTLKTAQQYVDEIWQVAASETFLRTIVPEYMDTISLLAELRLRLAIRQAQHNPSLLADLSFDQLLQESRSFLTDSNCFQELPSNLKKRYELSLSYQHGVYLYHVGDHRQSLLKFQEVAQTTRLMGWVRVEQAAYSWLATLFEAMGLYQELSEILQITDVACLFNSYRIKLHNDIIERNAENEIIAKLLRV